MTIDKSGNLYITTKSCIVNVNFETQRTSIVTGDPNKCGFKDGHILSEALFDHPDGIACLHDPYGLTGTFFAI